MELKDELKENLENRKKAEHWNGEYQTQSVCYERGKRVFELIQKNKELTDQKFIMQDKALELANINMGMRLDKLNELRKEVTEDRSKFVTDERFSIQLKTIEDRIKSLELWQAKIYGMAALSSVIGGIVGAIVSLIVTYLRQ